MNRGFTRTTDLFTLPDSEGNHILYAPQHHFIGHVNPDVVNLLARIEDGTMIDFNESELACLEELAKHGVLNGSSKPTPVPEPPAQFAPRQVTLFPTNLCNLRCLYCYAEAGDIPSKNMPWSIGKTALDLVIANVKKAGEQHVGVGFHGGGEPLLREDFVRKAVGYVQDTCLAENLSPKFSAATNGVLEEDYLDWIIEHFSGLSISYDGLPDVQDTHRPLPGCSGSSSRVERTFRRLDAAGFSYSIRATVSSLNVDRMEESLDYIYSRFKPQSVSFEPLHFCGRCQTGALQAPDLPRFGLMFSKCRDRAREAAYRVEYSGCRLGKLSHSFCGVTRDNFAVTPDGFITTCYEVLEKDDPRSDTFFIGTIGEEGTLTIHDSTRRRLHSLTVDNLEYCRDCFAKWNCSGDCLAKVENEDYEGDRGHGRCRLNRDVLAHELRAAIKSRTGEPTSDISAGGRT